jgi:hypothetical protein
MSRQSPRPSHASRLVWFSIVLALAAACSPSAGPGWTSATVPDGDGASIAGVAAGSASIVAVGQVAVAGESNHAAIWVSPDGKAWTRATDDPSFSLSQMAGVAASASGYMAVGGACSSGECFAAQVWASSDGHAWHAVPAVPVESGSSAVTGAVAAGGAGWMVGGLTFGSDPNDTAPSIWTTPDGSTWTHATVPLPPADSSLGGSVGGLASNGGTQIAVGAVRSATNRAAAVWLSTDNATTWTAVPPDPTFSGSLMSAVVAGGPGFVAVGRDGSGAAAWTSTDGSAWKQDASGPGFAGAQMTSVATRGGRFVAVGYDGNTALVWTSADGLTWVQAPGTDMAGAQAVGVTMTASIDVAVGSASHAARIWTASP